MRPLVERGPRGQGCLARQPAEPSPRAQRDPHAPARPGVPSGTCSGAGVAFASGSSRGGGFGGAAGSLAPSGAAALSASSRFLMASARGPSPSSRFSNAPARAPSEVSPTAPRVSAAARLKSQFRRELSDVDFDACAQRKHRDRDVGDRLRDRRPTTTANAAVSGTSSSSAAPLMQGTGMWKRPSVRVRRLQRVLERAGFDVGAPGADGRFGPLTAAAVRRMQGTYGLVPDAIVGPKTSRLVSLVADRQRARRQGSRNADRASRTPPADAQPDPPTAVRHVVPAGPGPSAPPPGPPRPGPTERTRRSRRSPP
jgi:putative peptidoglycan binding protein